MHRTAPRLHLCFFALFLELLLNPAHLSVCLAATRFPPPAPTGAWWIWPLALFLCCIVIGMFSVLGGVGSGLLYLALVSALFPFHIDYVRMAAILVSLAGALMAGSGLLRRNLVDLHLTLPTALVSSLGAICGALLGANLSPRLIQVGLGAALLVIAPLLTSLPKVLYPPRLKQDSLGTALGIGGTYREHSTRQIIDWQSHATLPGLLIAFPIGLFTGIFGLEGGWAHVTVFNLVMGIPFKVAVGTGKLLLTFTHSSAAWIYMNQGCVLPLLTIPSIIGVILGAFAGLQAQLWLDTRLHFIRHLAIGALILGGIKVLIQGLAH